MSLPSARRLLAIGALAGALLILGTAVERLAAQEGCVFGEDGNDIYQTRPFPGGGTVTYVTRPHFLCDDGVQIWADSAEAYSADALSHLIGRVRYLDRSRELTASEARYFSNVGRLQATGGVVVIDRADGSRVENGDLVYLRQTDFRDEETMTVTTGRDGLRPRATLPPPEPAATDSTAITSDSIATDRTASPRDSAATVEREPSPYTVVGDRIVFRGSSYFSSTGSVEIERDSLFAFGDSAEYAEASERLVLVGSARVVSSQYVLVGRTITMGADGGGTNEVRAVRDALLTGDDLTLTAPVIRLYLVDGAVERLVAVPLPPDAAAWPTGGPASLQSATGPLPTTTRSTTPTADSADAELASNTEVRPLAVGDGFELTADSLDLSAPDEVVDHIFAAGRARSVSYGRDSLNVENLPEIARQDWLEGDTIVISLASTPRRPNAAGDSAASSVTPSGEDAGRGYQIETIVARVGARNLYRLPPQDSTAQAGVDSPAVHYVVGGEITIHMHEGAVEVMEVVGQTRGVHLEPLARAAAGDTIVGDTIAADSSAVPLEPRRRQ